MNSISMELNIQRFAEGGSDGGSSESATVAQSQETGVEADNNTANVPVAGEQKESRSLPDLSSYSEDELKELIDSTPALNKVVGKKFSGAFGKRLAEERSKMQEEMKPVNDLIYDMMAVHNVNSIEELSKIVRPSIRDQFSIENGTADEISDEVIKVRANNIRKHFEEEAAKKFRNEIEKRQYIEQESQRVNEEVENIKKLYPSFDLGVEMKNPQFAKMLNVGVSLEAAYEAMHLGEIVEAAKRSAADAYSKSMSQMHNRPNENGLGNQAAVNGQRDVSKLTKKERAELAERARRGEKITF